MPLYEYACTDCGEHCEVLQKTHESDPQNCPHCQHSGLQRIVSNFGTNLPGVDSRRALHRRLPKSHPRTNGAATTPTKGPACGHNSGFSQRLKQYEKRI
jgi:putative FmdB family regulatory protein